MKETAFPQFTHPSPGKPKKYPEGTTKKTYCLPTHKFEEADRAIKKLLDRYVG